MLKVGDVARFLADFAPLCLAEEWDNVGLLLGRRSQRAARIMTCLTVTPASAAEAVEEKADLLVTHHPILFRPARRIIDDCPEGRILLDLAAAKVAVYSPHTAFDSAAAGINQRLAEALSLADVSPLRALAPSAAAESSPAAALLGSGRYGTLPSPASLAAVARQLKKFLRIEHAQVVGDGKRKVRRVAVGCGSAGELLGDAIGLGCELFVTGEARFHACLEAESAGVAMLLVGHYASERFGVEALAAVLADQFKESKVWASGRERDPLDSI
ncbi:MAG: Nif3-like dinuclear metal center hexameric protein [Planctomycetia bacterium]|nr:Nif3-like dinuclear metal center hexameric protein [Planctomycetia bacterium]